MYYYYYSYSPSYVIDNYNSYFPDPDFGSDRYWDIQIYNQHHLHFYNNFIGNTTEIESDLPETDQNLNTTLSKAIVDPWQNTQVVLHPTISEEPLKELPQVGPPDIDCNDGRTICEHADLARR